MTRISDDDYRSVDEKKWEEVTQQFVNNTARQYQEMRIEYAITLEIGGRVACALFNPYA